MVFVKNIILIFILVICSYLGIEKAKGFKIRENELKKFKNALNIFKTKINYTYEPIGDIFMQISKLEYKDRDNIFLECINFLNKNEMDEAWDLAVEKDAYITHDEDKDVLKILGKTLGKTDKEGQINEIDLVNDFLNKQISKAEELRTKNEKMYKTLGITLGIALVIIFI